MTLKLIRSAWVRQHHTYRRSSNLNSWKDLWTYSIDLPLHLVSDLSVIRQSKRRDGILTPHFWQVTWWATISRPRGSVSIHRFSWCSKLSVMMNYCEAFFPIVSQYPIPPVVIYIVQIWLDLVLTSCVLTWLDITLQENVPNLPDSATAATGVSADVGRGGQHGQNVISTNSAPTQRLRSAMRRVSKPFRNAYEIMRSFRVTDSIKEELRVAILDDNLAKVKSIIARHPSILRWAKLPQYSNA